MVDEAERPPAQTLNQPVTSLDHMPGGAKSWARKVTKAGWHWRAHYSLIWLYKAGQRKEWVLHHSFLVAAAPTEQIPPAHIHAVWDAEHLDGQGVLEADYKLRHQVANPQILGLTGTIKTKEVSAILAGEWEAPHGELEHDRTGPERVEEGDQRLP